MPRRLSLSRRLGTASRWPAGIALTSWRYMWRTTPIHRSEVPGELPADGPPALPEGVVRDEIQAPAAGSGPLFHRIYRAVIREARMGPDELVARIAADLDCVAPTEFVTFRKVLG